MITFYWKSRNHDSYPIQNIAINSLCKLTIIGPAPNVTKHTQAVLQVDGEEDFRFDKFEWDVRVQGQDKDTLTLQVLYSESLG